MFNLFKKKTNTNDVYLANKPVTHTKLDAVSAERYHKAKVMALKNGWINEAIELLNNADYGELSTDIKDLQLRTLPHYYKKYKANMYNYC